METGSTLSTQDSYYPVRALGVVSIDEGRNVDYSIFIYEKAYSHNYVLPLIEVTFKTKL